LFCSVAFEDLGYPMTHTSTTSDADPIDTVSTIGIQLQRIRHFWPLVLLVTLGAVIAAAVSAYTAAPSYTGRTVLIVSSPGRVPEEDAVIVRGYVDLFNDPAYQTRLRDSLDLPAGTTFEARTAAASSMIFVEATNGSYAGAKDAALDIATEFRWDVDALRRAEKDENLAALRNELDERRALLTSGGDPAYIVPRILELETTIQQMQGDSTNQLQILQPDAGVSTSQPSVPKNVLFGLVGGLILGSLAAVLAALFSGRLGTAHDVRLKTGLAPAGEVPRGGTPRRNHARSLGFTRLATRVGPRQVPRPATLAVVSPTRTPATAQTTRAIAEYAARNGERVILLHQNSDHDGSDTAQDLPTFAATVRTVSVDTVPGDPDNPADRARFVRLVQRLGETADLVIVELPALTEDDFAHSMCAASTLTLLVLDRRTERVRNVREAAELLGDANPIVVAMVDPRERSNRKWFRHKMSAETGATVRFEQVDDIRIYDVSPNGHRRDRDVSALVTDAHGTNP